MSERPTYTLKGETGNWELVMGLEVHAQVASEAKLFSGASTRFGADPNCNVSLVDAAMPGMLPVINRKCVEQAVRTGLGLKAKINKYSRFDRKNYFYPDLPQGYQISQFDFPIVGEGEIEVDVEPAHGDPAYAFTVRIERLHLEQDAGKSIHDMAPDATYVDLNRSGVALMEIVSKPDVRTPLEAAAYVKKLKSIVVALGTCDGDMEKGNLRADVNVSVCKPGAYEKFRETGDFGHLGTRCEIKNMNSFRFIQQAIEYEARRQIEILESGGKVDQETRLFDPTKGETRSMRSKEDAHDYRYFPDPDLLPLEIDDLFIDNIRASLPELPDERKERYKEKFLIENKEYLNPLVSDAEFGNIFEDQFTLLFGSRDFDDRRELAAILASLGVTGAEASKIFAEVGEESVVEFLRENPSFDVESFAGQYAADAETMAGLLCVRVRGAATKLDEDPILLARRLKMWELAQLLRDKVISSRIANEVFERMIEGEGDPGAIVETHGLKQVTDTGAIETIIDKIIADNPEQAASVKEKPKAMGWFVGQVMKESGGKANPQAVNQILRQKLGL